MIEEKQPIIRDAASEDIAYIAELEKVCFPEDPWSYDSIANDISNNDNAFYIVAEREKGTEKEIVGYVGVWKVVDECHIMNVAVEPSNRRQNIGDDLISSMIDITKQLGVNSWTLEVRADNEPAIKLYKKHGFKEAGLRKGYYEYDHMDAIIMWRELI